MPLVIAWALSQHLIERVYFFGSRVRGTHRINSDLDIAIQLIYPEPDTAAAHWSFEEPQWTAQLSSLIPWQLDLELLCPPDSPTISAGIKESSLLVYQRQP